MSATGKEQGLGSGSVPPGPCLETIGDGGRFVCELRHGHAGGHETKDGIAWTKTPPSEDWRVKYQTVCDQYDRHIALHVDDKRVLRKERDEVRTQLAERIAAYDALQVEYQALRAETLDKSLAPDAPSNLMMVVSEVLNWTAREAPHMADADRRFPWWRSLQAAQRGALDALRTDPCASDTRPRLHGDHGPYLEDMALARAVARRLAPHAAAMTDAQLDADPMVGWVSCLFRRVRDENGERDGQPERDAGANRGDGGESPGGGRPGPGDDRAGGAGAEGASARTASSGVGPRTSDAQPKGSK